MIEDEHFVPVNGLDLTPYIQSQDTGAVHHLIRYTWALEVIGSLPAPKHILDVACGAGYGSFLFAQRFPHISVTGADYDSKAVTHARQHYVLPNLTFINGDVTRWEETIGSTVFDCIVSFDTIEHVPHREIMLENLIRHLSQTGVLLLSTPCGGPVNELQPAWPAHRIEYSTASLYDLLSRYFRSILRPDGGTFPAKEVFNRLQGTSIDYLLRLNPVVCTQAIRIPNPYLEGSASRVLSNSADSVSHAIPGSFPPPAAAPLTPALADMPTSVVGETPPSWSYEEISGGGERVTHLYPNDCYYAHLSVYYFATQFCQGGDVLDAGSGAGYGSAYLADHGAKHVNAVELSKVSVAFSQHHFKLPNLKYQVMNLENITCFPPHAFDMIYSSNVLEHVPEVVKFIRTSAQLLKPEGTLVVAVPPIVREVDWAENIANIYHLNIWTPRQWYQVFNHYFDVVECYWHGLRLGLPLDFHNTPEQTVINEKDFIFKPVSVDHYYREPSLGVIFVIRSPRPERKMPLPSQPVTFIENSFTRPLPSQTNPLLSTLAQPAAIQKTFSHLLNRARSIASEQGLLAVIPAAVHHLKWRIKHHRSLEK